MEKEVNCTDLGQESVHRRTVVITAMNCETFTKQALS
jgi:hypothetical protein